MNLYKITFSHHGPKDSESGIKCLLLAENDEQVYNWIASEPEVNDDTMFNSWKEKESAKYDKDQELFIDDDGNEYYWTDEKGKPEDFKTRILRFNGEINDDNYDFADVYYGITLFGWELLKENVTESYSELETTGILFKV